VLNRAGIADDAIAAGRHAVELEPDNWRHELRLAFVAWGEERLRAASRALALLPGLGLAHFLAATVHVARQSFAEAARHLDAGAAAQDEQRTGRSRFSAVGLHWLRGLVLLRGGEELDARKAFEQELSFESAGHLYSSECCAHVHYALGALALREGDRAGAIAAFDRALARASGHVMPLAARHALLHTGSDAAFAPEFEARLAATRDHGFTIDATVAACVRDVLNGDYHRAASAIHRALTDGPGGPQGWLIPVDPLLNVAAHPEAWSAAFAALRRRAA
jgi:tetratricopeptide (TPR) repeat protein